MKHFLKHTALAAGLFCSLTAAQAETITLKVHHFLGPQSIQHTKMMQTWCDNIAKDSGNRLACQIYPAMQLGGSPPQLFDQAKDGVADVVWTVAGYSAGRFARSQVFELPFMMTNAAATSRAAWDFAQKYAQDEYKDVKLLAIHVHGPGVFFTKNKAITKMEDLKGLKVRGPTATVTKMLGMMGATPVGMPVPQVPEALSKGVIDGAVIPYEVAPGLKVHELTKFASETPKGSPALYTTVFVVPMNKAKYESLPADLKKVIDANSGRDLSGRIGKAFVQADAEGNKLTAKNVHNVIPASELATWKKLGDKLAADWVKDTTAKGLDGAQLLKDARDLIAKYQAQ